MSKRLEEYVKYTKAELDWYVSTPGSCVHKININRHYCLDPYVLSDLNKALPAYILKHEISYYEPKLKGVLLAVKKIKVLNGVAAIRADDPHLHIDINADCYVFRPEKNAELTGVVKHIGKQHVSVVLYRVFNAKINFEERIDKEQLTLGQELKFRVRSFGLNGIFVNIHGELLTCPAQVDEACKKKNAKTITFGDEENENSGTPDSGIDESELIDLDELINSIKNEPLSEEEFPSTSNHKSKITKLNLKKTDSITDLTQTANSNGTSNQKYKRKSSTDSNTSNIKADFVKKIKKEKED